MEGLPNALIEALAAGVPTVTSELSGIPELIEDGITGLLAKQGDPQDLRRALKRVLEDPAAAVERAEAGRRVVEASFDIEASARRLGVLFAQSRITAQNLTP